MENLHYLLTLLNNVAKLIALLCLASGSSTVDTFTHPPFTNLSQVFVWKIHSPVQQLQSNCCPKHLKFFLQYIRAMALL